MKKLAFMMAIWASLTLHGQNAADENLVHWSSTKKLSLDDFGIKTGATENMQSFAQFSIDYKVNGFDFMSRSFNKKVGNYVIKSASSIDTLTNTALSLRYQQTLFDLSEIYARQFRRALKENRRKIASGTQFIEGISQKIMTDFANRRLQYTTDTNFGSILEKQAQWEQIIQQEISALSEYSTE
jgi:hypothetical protein